MLLMGIYRGWFQNPMNHQKDAYKFMVYGINHQLVQGFATICKVWKCWDYLGWGWNFDGIWWSMSLHHTIVWLWYVMGILDTRFQDIHLPVWSGWRFLANCRWLPRFCTWCFKTVHDHDDIGCHSHRSEHLRCLRFPLQLHRSIHVYTVYTLL